MGRQMLRYMVCDICETKKVESITDSKGNNSEYDTGITEWEMPILITGNDESIENQTIDVCESCLKKVTNVEWGIINGVAIYKIRNEE